MGFGVMGWLWMCWSQPGAMGQECRMDCDPSLMDKDGCCPEPEPAPVTPPPVYQPPPVVVTPPSQPVSSSCKAGSARSGAYGYPMVSLCPGEVTLGSPEGEAGRSSDEHLREVEITQGFAMGTVEVSQGLYKKVMQENPTAKHCAEYEGVSLVDDSYPVVCVTWHEAVVFANELSRLEGLARVYYQDAGFDEPVGPGWEGEVYWKPGVEGYRLPTEAEWEYAARAPEGGRDSHPMYSGWSGYARTAEEEAAAPVCDYGNVLNPSAAKKFGFSWTPFNCEDGYAALAPVDAGKFKSNRWGLYQMSGNVWEWVWDAYTAEKGNLLGRDASDPRYPEGDAAGVEGGSGRVFRGGSWDVDPDSVRVALRDCYVPGYRYYYLGFRLSRSSPEG